MPISNLGNGLRTGVCTSTNRPTTPYEGQVIYETDTDLSYIYNGSSWQQVSGGTAVGNSGLVYVTSATIPALSTSVSVSNCFSATYDNYRIIFTATIATANIRWRLNYRDSGGDVVAANYQYGAFGLIATNTVGVDYSGTSGQTVTLIGESGVGSSRFQGLLDVGNPFATEQTTATWTASGTLSSTVPNLTFGVSHYLATTSLTGFTIQRHSGTGTFSGKIFVYGYRQA